MRRKGIFGGLGFLTRHCSTRSTWPLYEKRLNVDIQTPDDGQAACHSVELVLGVSKTRYVKKNPEDDLLTRPLSLGTRNCVVGQESVNNEVR